MVVINESIDMKDTLNRVLRKAKRASLVLDTWMEEYGFTDSTKPKSRFIKESIDSSEGTEHYNTYKWIYEYNRIVNLIDIVSDYIDGIENEISKLEETA